MGNALRGKPDPTVLMSDALGVCADALRAEAAILWAVGAARSPLTADATHGVAAGCRLAPGEGVAGWVAAHAEVAVAPDGPARLAADEPEGEGALAVPVYTGGHLSGVLAVYGRAYDEDDAVFLEVLARQLETGLENAFLLGEAQRLSLTDGLTGLWNRRQLDLRAAEAMQVATRFGEPFALLLLDIDHFKGVNDRLGHQTGDAVLVEVAGRVASAVREVDVVARYGGEEFALLLPRTEPEGAALLAEKVRSLIADRPFQLESGDLTVTASIGVACHPQHGGSVRELLAAADAALYRAKGAGRNRVEEAAAIDPRPAPCKKGRPA
jgi:two-component system cell cycle response regulator